MEKEIKKEIKKPHSFEVKNRKCCSMTGIEKIISSSAQCLSVVSSLGAMEINGKNLRINEYSVENGTLSFEGDIDAIKYTAAKVSFLKRLFK